MSKGGTLRKFSLFKSKTAVAESAQRGVDELTGKVDMVTSIVHMIHVRLASHELPRFRALKGAFYADSVKRFTSELIDEAQQKIRRLEKVGNASFAR
jgi:hypothetical protein